MCYYIFDQILFNYIISDNSINNKEMEQKRGKEKSRRENIKGKREKKKENEDMGMGRGAEVFREEGETGMGKKCRGM